MRRPSFLYEAKDFSGDELLDINFEARVLLRVDLNIPENWEGQCKKVSNHRSSNIRKVVVVVNLINKLSVANKKIQKIENDFDLDDFLLP